MKITKIVSASLTINLYDEGDIWTVQGILSVNSLQSSNSWFIHKEIVTAGDELGTLSWEHSFVLPQTESHISHIYTETFSIST